MKYRLGELCEIVSGSTPKTSIQEYWDGNIKWITPAELNDDSYIITDSVRKITELGVRKTGLSPFPAGTVILSSRAPIGKVAIAGCEMYCNQGFKNLICSERISNRYLFWFLKGNTEYLNSLGRGATFKEISKQIVSSIEINVPNIKEQEDAVSVLEQVSSIIQLRKQELSQLDDLVKARFVEMFGEPIDNPKGWETKKLKDLSTLITNGNTPKGGSENYVENGIMFLRSQNVWRNRLDLSDVAYIDEATNQKLSKSVVMHNDILITKTGRINTENSSLGRATLYSGVDRSANINGHVYLVRLKETVVPEFVVTILTGEAYRRYIRKVCVGGIDKRQINLDQVEDFPIIMPPIHLQQQFSDFVQEVDKSKVVVQKALDDAQLLFDNLMQQYFG